MGIAILFLSCSNTNADKIEHHVPLKIENLSDTFPDANYLIEAGEAFSLLQDQNSPLVVIEISKSEDFLKGHIKKSINLWRDDYGKQSSLEIGGMRASKEEMEQLLSRLGMHPQTTILVYDTKGSVDAIRFIWMLEIYGHQNILLLNGGKKAWQLAGYPLSKEKPMVRKPSNYKFDREPNYTFLADIEDVKKALKDTNSIILDTRELEEYLGQPYINKGKVLPYKKGAFTNGCIPEAIHLNWSRMVSLNDDHRFYSVKRMKKTLKNLGITPDKQIITYCQSGVRSMHTTYVLRDLLGYPNVKNYDGSWIEWSYYHIKDGSVPVKRHTSEEGFEQIKKQLEGSIRHGEIINSDSQIISEDISD